LKQPIAIVQAHPDPKGNDCGRAVAEAHLMNARDAGTNRALSRAQRLCARAYVVRKTLVTKSCRRQALQRDVLAWVSRLSVEARNDAGGTEDIA